MAKLKFGTDVPSVFNSKALNTKSGSLAALKNVHQAFQGYSISEDEKVTLPSWQEIEKSPASFLKEQDARVGSRNKTMLVRVIRTKGSVSKESWLNLSVLSRQCNDAEGNRTYPDELREVLASMDSDYERLQYVAGHTLVATGSIDAYRPIFEDGAVKRDEDGERMYESASYVTIEMRDAE